MGRLGAAFLILRGDPSLVPLDVYSFEYSI